jgi:hypothetical protein
MLGVAANVLGINEPVAAPTGVLHQQGVPTGAEPFTWHAVMAVPQVLEWALNENGEIGRFTAVALIGFPVEAHC